MHQLSYYPTIEILSYFITITCRVSHIPHISLFHPPPTLLPRVHHLKLNSYLILLENPDHFPSKLPPHHQKSSQRLLVELRQSLHRKKISNCVVVVSCLSSSVLPLEDISGVRLLRGVSAMFHISLLDLV